MSSLGILNLCSEREHAARTPYDGHIDGEPIERGRGAAATLGVLEHRNDAARVLDFC